ncbi:hypothetical protein GCM10010156_03470 [Planobispora rosea]|uniref:Diguanylate cyclase/phosphodiesterase n=1 Tax=Planobispora rosea TaxID=35762 RepID=A0A8J3RVJ4_PLARO|nr:bifunctional diguanylate cyclase/phosphodiesterase [Planobispora rosea]GGS48010.1 hypothetical protein GCM10010156_03470 [Planobispora rosea]GIH82140.1 hypothetical protein Pro02_05480 [Planobispora rosea]
MSRLPLGAFPSALSRPAGGSRVWAAYLLLGTALTAAAPFLASVSPTLGVLVWVLLQGASATAVIAGARLNRLTGSWPWRLLCAASVLAWLSTTLFWAAGHVWLELSGAMVLYRAGTLSAYVLSLAALAMLNLRVEGSRAAALLDAGIITVGVAMPFWTFLVGPMIDGSGHTGAHLAFAVAIPVIDLFAFGLLMRLALDNGRALWLGLLSASYVALFAGDGVYLLNQVAAQPSGPVSTIGWLGFSVLSGAAVLHPSLGSAHRLRTAPVSSRARVVTFLALALLSPLGSGLGRALLDVPGAHEPFGELVTTAFTVLMAVLLVLRLNTVARVAENRAGELATALHQQEILQRSLSYRALHDPLTGLANRTLLGQSIQHAITAGAAVPGTPPPALLLLDLDRFKDVNDTYGHAVGDELLTHVTHRLNTTVVTDGQTLARLGGDEFALLLPAATAEDALAVAQRILAGLRAPYRLGGRELYVTTSVGVLAGLPVASPSEALRDADLALYAAKNAGKDQVTVFAPALRHAQLERTRLTAGLRQAVEGGELVLNYQPVVNLAGGEIRAVEALLRWSPPGSRPVPPDVFIPIAEETGLIVPIGRWVLEQACADAHRWHEQYGISVTVNISGRQLREEDFTEMVLGTLARYGLPEGALVLEITESMLLATTPAETQRLIAVLTALREHGVRIAMDDFGTGYSSLSYLRTLPVDILKIDRSFTTALTDDDQRTRAFTKAILELAASLRVDTVVEGVELHEQAVLLQRMGCPLAQGYLFSPPVSALQIDNLLSLNPWRHAA